MKLSMQRHFILLAIAILFELNKVGSSRRRWQSNRKCDVNVIFNTGNTDIFNRGVNCGGHSAKTCSQCPCQRGVYMSQGPQNYCNHDCQWRRGACRPRRPHNECAGAVFNTGNVICGRHRAILLICLIKKIQIGYTRLALKALVRFCECSRQVKAEVVNNISNEIHQTWPKPFSRTLQQIEDFEMK